MSSEPASSPLVVRPAGVATVSDIPAIVTQCGEGARFAWEEFFLGVLRNRHTRQAYLQAVRRFLTWGTFLEIELPRITPGMVGRYLDELPLSTPSKKLHLAAIRSFLDVLVQRHVIVINPALSVRAPRYSALEGKTPEITVSQCRTLLASIRCHRPIDYRDRAILATLIYTAARVGAVGKLRRQDLVDDGLQYLLRFEEKGGKGRLIPVRSDLEEILAHYLQAARLEKADLTTPLFRSSLGRSGELSDHGLSPSDIGRMVKRRLEGAGLSTRISCHSFRGCAATDLLSQGVDLDQVQYLLGHADPRTTRLYDYRQKRITRNIVERISV